MTPDFDNCKKAIWFKFQFDGIFYKRILVSLCKGCLVAYIFGIENSCWFYMTYSSEIIGTAPGHWLVKSIQLNFILEIHYSVVSSVISAQDF